MQGRRRDPRFTASPPWPAALHVLDDVVLERTWGDEIWVIAETAGHVGDTLTLEFLNDGLQLDVSVLESEPLIVEGRVEHRLHLRVHSRRRRPSGGAGQPSGDDVDER